MKDLKDSTRDSGNEEVVAYRIKLLCKQKIKNSLHHLIKYCILYENQEKQSRKKFKSFAKKEHLGNIKRNIKKC